MMHCDRGQGEGIPIPWCIGARREEEQDGAGCLAPVHHGIGTPGEQTDTTETITISQTTDAGVNERS